MGIVTHLNNFYIKPFYICLSISLCDENGIEINNGTIGTNVSNCTCYIPLSGCNAVGAGMPPVADADNDGVPDDQDEYPDDPDRAFNSYYPNKTDYGTLAFEDLWPATGDYDFNDLVINFQYQMVSNAGNDYIDLIGHFHLKAIGAGKNSGFGFALEVAPSSTQSVQGTVVAGSAVNFDPAGYESGHTAQTVVFVYDAIVSIAGWSMVNTTHGGNTLTFDTTTITVNFASPQSNIGDPPYNPFIFIGQQRGMELHLIDNAPTALVDAQYFGTLADASNPAAGSYYKTSNLLPWAIEIPVDFDYPIEKTDIILSHLKFVEWAISGGISYNDWFLDLEGYRNHANIY